MPFWAAVSAGALGLSLGLTTMRVYMERDLESGAVAALTLIALLALIFRNS